MSSTAKNTVLILLVVALAFFPLVFIKGGQFAGADDRAEKAITSIDPNYHPWFKNIWEPPSGEVETFLFALQAALGAGFVGYFLGYARGRKKRESAEQSVAGVSRQKPVAGN
ncbi:energy-coupling factor ABC transporter substrate-binding protein [Desulfotomaculum copahuensis]|uniref:Cobalt transport protein CbiN n=1 Tax=Desulfotomaculum copahuensis TaxID=1838280 RepID=A0A1B7LBP7_9FIRM|nr:energy-coupling factor ABC transporter substrate-binding protein [Desulfotomaculum copahuensis]OAT79955.1 cobalt ABC transporter substrate-binding protein CbiN [Desulfotomaculum copahuensis]